VLATVRERPVEVPLELDRAFAGFHRLAVEPLFRRWRSIGSSGVGLRSTCRGPELVRVHEIAGGNPFFALELGRAIARARSAWTARMSRCPRA
jgi:hypothetical protein